MQEQLWTTFKAVAEVGSISKAARQLNLSQSAVSQQVQQLEDEYGAALLIRSAQGVQLTPAGELLYRYVNRIVRTIQESREAVRSLSQPDAEKFRIGASLTIAEYLLPDLLTTVWRPGPHQNLAVIMANSRNVLDQVLHHQLDVGLIEADLRSPQLVTRPFQDDSPLVIVRQAHPWAGAGHVSVEEFLKEPLIIREPGSGTRMALEEGLDQVGLGLDSLNIRMVLGTTQAIKAMVLSGMGVSVLSPLTVRPTERADYQFVRVDGIDFRRSFYLIHQRDLSLPVARHFVEGLLRWSARVDTSQETI